MRLENKPNAMGQILSTLIAFLVVVIVGLVVTPMAGGLIASLVVLAFTWLSRPLANLVGRYGGFCITAYAYALAIAWVSSRFHIVAWALWIPYAVLILWGFATLLRFDVQCFRDRSGAWSDD